MSPLSRVKASESWLFASARFPEANRSRSAACAAAYWSDSSTPRELKRASARESMAARVAFSAATVALIVAAVF